MFDRSDVDSYLQISAPPSLKAKVMTLEKEKQPARKMPVRFAGVLAAAACLVLAAVGAILWNPAPETVVTLDGSPLTAEAVVITPEENQPAMVSARVVPPVTVELLVELSEDAEISVSGGTLMIFSEDALLASGTDCVVSGSLRVEWTVPFVPGASETITVGEREFELSHTEEISTIREIIRK